ncbi:hypothetical protein [Paracoccus aerodenitrificans]|uniref:hypothetical protein n=1 Tax=Paracoccus aerodenitrificans TaxID=3017781 RepID=UPI0022F0760E|nr:hypothetical protein [Paracoccus aerodenitrificans]WBU64336.1 hypothetical protein PAE61_02490 [Paracoccus aerodenitrificans]
MGLIRPELARWLTQRRELLAALATVLFGGWLALRGGWFFFALGAAVFATGAVWAVTSWRRLAFLHDVTAPGVVEVVEGEIRYFGARSLGGSIALHELNEIRLIRLNGQDHWRLKSRDGQALLIPVEARGAEQLADAFTALPGLDLGRVSAALQQTEGPSLRIVWTRPKPG